MFSSVFRSASDMLLILSGVIPFGSALFCNSSRSVPDLGPPASQESKQPGIVSVHEHNRSTLILAMRRSGVAPLVLAMFSNYPAAAPARIPLGAPPIRLARMCPGASLLPWHDDVAASYADAGSRRPAIRGGPATPPLPEVWPAPGPRLSVCWAP
jgi:hypothetical protein